MKTIAFRWVPMVLLGIASVFIVGVDIQRPMSLRAPLARTIPLQVAGLVGRDVTLRRAEQRIAAATDYLLRYYEARTEAGDAVWFSLYVAFYAQQSRGKTIHSPKNCLPGSGWQVLASRTSRIESADGRPVTVNRYILRRDREQALVLYWYQGRGRVQANEYIVKWDLLRDSALRGRSDEALVRIVVPITGDEASAFDLASSAARELMPAVAAALPG